MTATKSAPDRPIDRSHKDHSGCAHDPARLGADRGSLTPARRRILDELCEARRPLGAYELIDRLGSVLGKRPAPISVYRALDFLVDAGLVHRLASRSAYLACSQRHDTTEAIIFLICDRCGSVTETTSGEITDALRRTASRTGFKAAMAAM